jgi:FecR protein
MAGPDFLLEVSSMNARGLRFFPFLVACLFLVSLAPGAPTSPDSRDRDVRVAFVQGDVRLSRGHHNHTDLKQPWESAQPGEAIERGFALATGNGRAEIEFDNGSAVFVVENSLLLFAELPPPGNRIVSRMTLATGSATFWVESPAESFSIETPTDKVQIQGPQTFSLRFNAYLDATAITPVGGKLDNVAPKGTPNLQVDNGKTVFFQGGAILSAPDSGENLPWKESADGTPDPEMKLENYLFRPREQQLLGRDWDQWVETRVQEKQATMAAALKASGLSAPVPGLTDLYLHGNFFACEPYGTCWEPTQTQAAQESETEQAPATAQTPLPNASQQGRNVGFQPQTVQWEESEWSGPCDFGGGHRTITRVARTPEQLKELLRLRSLASSNLNYQGVTRSSCYTNSWIYRRHRYAMVLPRKPPVCMARKCKPVHTPHPIFVRVGSKVGFVPRHPDDVKGKPPINLKHGIIVPALRPGEETRQIAWNPSQKLTFLDKAPKEFAREIAAKPLPVTVPAPEIHAHVVEESARNNGTNSANHADSHIVYNYKTQTFMMRASTVAGTKGKDIPVGAIASNGRVATFAGSGGRAEPFSHNGPASSYSSGANSARNSGGNSGSHSYSSGSSGANSGWHSYSSGSSAASGGSFSHSSGGGGSVSSSSSAASSSSSASPGASHGSRPR